MGEGGKKRILMGPPRGIKVLITAVARMSKVINKTSDTARKGRTL